MRAVAAHDPDHFARLLDWPLVDLLTAFRERVAKPRLLEQWRHDMTVWALLAPHSKQPGKPPDPPALLRA